MKRFNELRSGIREKLGIEGAKTTEDCGDNSSVEDDKNSDSAKYDSSAIRILEAVRNNYLENNLAGSVEVGIYIYSPLGVSSKQISLSCDIDAGVEQKATDENATVDENATADEQKEEKSTIEKMAIKASLAGIKNLCKRAKRYSGKSYRSNLSLSETLSISMPIVGLFSVYVTISASVDSLLSCALGEV
mmetsp:Transcript_14397/g.19713  ORF Transcript_14397/g.19713 Transcript_14397/m.19713 type:complete len:190 (-) Transcript_14397:4574-5143(-)